jgi:hypothetical protein
MKKKLLKVIGCIIVVIFIWNHLPYYYNNDKVADYITKNAAPKSRTMCAGYVIIAMWHGRCPIGLIPAYAYNKTLPQIGFEEIPLKGYKPKKGDISVVPSNSKHPFGHIAVYNGKQWVSDFKQHHILPSRAYKANGKYQIFRATDGWHWKHVWTTPVDWYGWIKATIKGGGKIKF